MHGLVQEPSFWLGGHFLWEEDPCLSAEATTTEDPGLEAGLRCLVVGSEAGQGPTQMDMDGRLDSCCTCTSGSAEDTQNCGPGHTSAPHSIKAWVGERG